MSVTKQRSLAFNCARTPEAKRERDGEMGSGRRRMEGERRWEREKRRQKEGREEEEEKRGITITRDREGCGKEECDRQG